MFAAIRRASSSVVPVIIDTNAKVKIVRISHDRVLVRHKLFHNAADAPVPRGKPIETIDGRRLPFGWRWGGDISKAMGFPDRRLISKAMGLPDRPLIISKAMGLPDRRHIPRRVK